MACLHDPRRALHRATGRSAAGPRLHRGRMSGGPRSPGGRSRPAHFRGRATGTVQLGGLRQRPIGGCVTASPDHPLASGPSNRRGWRCHGQGTTRRRCRPGAAGRGRGRLQLEIFFITGPLIVVGIAAAASPQAAFLSGAAMLAGGAIAFAATPASRRWRPTRGDGPAPPSALVAPGMRTLVAAFVLGGVSLGALEIAIPAFAEEEGLAGRFGLAPRPLGPRVAGRRALVRRAALAPPRRPPLRDHHRCARPRTGSAARGRLPRRVRGAGNGGRPGVGAIHRGRVADRRTGPRGLDHRGLRLAGRWLRGGRRLWRLARRTPRGRTERGGGAGPSAGHGHLHDAGGDGRSQTLDRKVVVSR